MEINYNGLQIEVSDSITTTAGYLATAQRCDMALFVALDPGSDCFDRGDLVFMSSDGNEAAKNAIYLFVATPEELARAILMQETENDPDHPIEMLTLLNDSRQNCIKHYACGVWYQSAEFFTVSLVPFLDQAVKTLDQKPLILSTWEEAEKSTDPRAVALRQWAAALSADTFDNEKRYANSIVWNLQGQAQEVAYTMHYILGLEAIRRDKIAAIKKQIKTLDEARNRINIDTAGASQYTAVIKELCYQIEALEVIR